LNVVLFNKNEALANSADTTHGGIAWNAHAHKDNNGKFLYKPAIHMVLGSVRFPQIPNHVRITVSDTTYCPPEHAPWIATDDLEAEILKQSDKMLKFCAIAGLRNHPFSKECKDIIAKVKEVFGEQAIATAFKNNKRTAATTSKKASQAKRPKK
jgi:hypothetical protein